MKAPHKHAMPYRGKAVYTFHVTVRQSGTRDASHDELFWQGEATVPVIARTPAEACNLVRDELAARVSYPTKIEAAGPRGGVTSRFIGWDSLVFARLLAVTPEQRLL